MLGALYSSIINNRSFCVCGSFCDGFFGRWRGWFGALACGAGLTGGTFDIAARIVTALPIFTNTTLWTCHIGARITNTLALFTSLSCWTVDTTARATLSGVPNTLSIHTLLCVLALDRGTARDTLTFAAEFLSLALDSFAWILLTQSIDTSFACGTSRKIAVFGDTFTARTLQAGFALDQSAEVKAATT